MADTDQIVVNSSALGGMIASLARDALKVAGAGLVTRGIATSDMVAEGAGVIVTAAPIIYSQLKTLWNHRKLVRLAEIVPNKVATVK